MNWNLKKKIGILNNLEKKNKEKIINDVSTYKKKMKTLKNWMITLRI